MTIAIVLGGADNARAELAEAVKLIHPRPVALFLVNDQIALYPGRAAHAVSLHPQNLAGWLNQRAYRSYPAIARVWADRYETPAPVSDLAEDWGGSSGMLGVTAALAAGLKRVVLCGVPMEVAAGHFFRQRPWNGAIFFRAAWIKHKEKLAVHVRSCSGFTAELLGRPDRAFVDG